MTTYECDNCGACCSMLIDLYPVDLLREPRLVERMNRYQPEGEDGEVGFLWSTSGPCQFLDGERRCSIYPTRPSVCVVFEAGGEDCQRVREEADLPPLLPITSVANRVASAEQAEAVADYFAAAFTPRAPVDQSEEPPA